MNRYLLNTFDFVLDRFLGGEELRIGRVDTVETGVQRGRLAGAGGPRDDEDAVRLLDDLADVIVNAFR